MPDGKPAPKEKALAIVSAFSLSVSMRAGRAYKGVAKSALQYSGKRQHRLAFLLCLW
jgi:hypothetical protein